MAAWQWWLGLAAGLCLWPGPWAVLEAALRCAVLAVLGLGMGCGLWALATYVNLQGGVASLLFRMRLGALCSGLRSAQPGAQRLGALRRLAALTQHRGAAGARCECPEGLLACLASCLLESGSEAAPLVLAVLSLPALFQDQISEAEPLAWPFRPRHALLIARPPLDRALFFSDASLNSLRQLFLSSQDRTLDKAFLRLFTFASRGLTGFQWDVPRIPPAKLRLGEEQLGQHQAFLRDPAVLGKLRGLLSDGDKGELLPDAMTAYSEVVGEEAGTNSAPPHPFSCCHFKAFRSLVLLGPVLRDLIQRMEELPEASRRCLSQARFLLSPLHRPVEAAEAVDDVLLPLLAQADRLSPHLLRWLLWAFPTDYQVSVRNWQWSSVVEKPLDCGEGRELRGKLLRGLSAALVRVAGCPDKTWALLGGLWDGSAWAGHSPQADPSLLVATVQAICDVERGWRDAAVDLALQMDWGSLGSAATELVVLSGGFKALRRLLHHHEEQETGAYGAKLGEALSSAFRLLEPEYAGPKLLDPLAAGATKVKRLVAWEDQGLGPVLRRLLDEEAGACNLRPIAQELLGEHRALSLAHPVLQPSTVPRAPISFPLN